jgi:hypothetical protein
MADTIKLNVAMEVPMIRLADLICEGFEGGVGYWAQIVKYDEPKELKYTMDTLEDKKFGEPHVYKHIDYPLNEGGAVYVMETGDDESGPIHRLDYEALMRGLKIMQEKWPRHFANWISETDDAETGDVFIQCCLLGDIVYG